MPRRSSTPLRAAQDTLDEVSSDPREAVVTWADGDAEPKPIQLNFLENDSRQSEPQAGLHA